MTTDFHASKATEQLDRVLGFFDRAESKASFLFAVDTGLLALIALNLRLDDFNVWYVVLLGASATLLIGASLVCLFHSTVPNLKGGGDSLIYFREISKKTEAKFIDDFLALNKEDFTRDVLGQVWRNSEILNAKFNSVRYAFIWTALALFPWTAFIGAVSILHSKLALG